MTHSPKPWQWEFHENDGTDAYPELAAHNGDCIMHFGGGDFTDGSGDSGMTPRNPFDAALIAAAPDLLEACKVALSYMVVYNIQTPTIGQYELCIAELLRVAIAKAEQTQPDEK